MTPLNKYRASVRNGSKSRGPLTPGTQATSAQNATTHGLSNDLHGLTMQTAVLANESKENARKLLDRYIGDWLPISNAEMELVEELAVARWRICRALTIETGAFDLTIGENREQLTKQHDHFDEGLHIAAAFKTLAAKDGPMNTLNRYDARLRANYNRALRNLLEVRAALRPPQKSLPESSNIPHSTQLLTDKNNELPNEPTATNTHPPVRGSQDNREETLC